jgi:hypothetical protein
VIVLDPGSVDNHIQEIAHRINGNVPLAPIDPLACIVSAFAARFSRLDTLRVDRTCCRLFVPTTLPTLSLAQGGVDSSPGTVFAPLAVVIVYAVVIGIVLWHILPLTTCADNVEHRVDSLAHIRFGRASRPIMFEWQQRFDDAPLPISQVACVKALFAPQWYPPAWCE